MVVDIELSAESVPFVIMVCEDMMMRPKQQLIMQQLIMQNTLVEQHVINEFNTKRMFSGT
jgi:hypothetical protein